MAKLSGHSRCPRCCRINLHLVRRGCIPICWFWFVVIFCCVVVITVGSRRLHVRLRGPNVPLRKFWPKQRFHPCPRGRLLVLIAFVWHCLCNTDQPRRVIYPGCYVARLEPVGNVKGLPGDLTRVDDLASARSHEYQGVSCMVGRPTEVEKWIALGQSFDVRLAL